MDEGMLAATQKNIRLVVEVVIPVVDFTHLEIEKFLEQLRQYGEAEITDCLIVEYEDE